MAGSKTGGDVLALKQQSAYVKMRDGTLIAVEIWLPDGLAEGDRIPTLVWFTRYWRARTNSDKQPAPKQKSFSQLVNDAGYAFAIVDVRGSGASFGCRPVEYPDEEVTDSGEMIQWLATQPWSNGRVATDGISYLGNTAELAASTGAQALRAAVPRFTDFDYYAQILFPGGLQNIQFLKDWGRFVRALDCNDVETLRKIFPEGYEHCLSIKPVDTDKDQHALEAALEDHRDNVYYTDRIRTWLFRDDVMGPEDNERSVRRFALYEYKDSFEDARVPMMHWAGWLDSAVSEGALARFLTFDTPNVTYIGPWNHGALSNANPFSEPGGAPSPGPEEQFQWIANFLDPYLKGDADPAQARREIHYFTMGEDRWKITQDWPPADVKEERWYLAANGGLSRKMPSALTGADKYAVDFEAGTGQLTRWATSMGGTPVDYGDRAEADQRLLTYTSAALKHDIEITGHPVVSLHVCSSHEDGAFIVYLEDVAPDGRVTYITEGIIRAIHRRVSDDPAPYHLFGPHHSYLRKDALPLIPGETAHLSFSLFPTSVLIRQGHAIRVAVAGHDKNNFVRVPASGNPSIELQRNSGCASCIDLPVVQRNANLGDGSDGKNDL